MIEIREYKAGLFATEKEFEAYLIGREEEEKVMIGFIKQWDGDCASEFGAAMYQTFQRLQDKDFFKTL